MKYEIEKRDKVAIVKTKIDKVDALHAPELKSELVLLNKDGERNIILDMSAVDLVYMEEVERDL